MRFSLVTVFVSDRTAVRNWYTANLGLTVAEETERFVRLADAGGRPCVAFHEGDPVGSPEQVQLHFEVDDVDAEHDRLRGRGLSFVEPPADKPWGWAGRLAARPRRSHRGARPPAGLTGRGLSFRSPGKPRGDTRGGES